MYPTKAFARLTFILIVTIFSIACASDKYGRQSAPPDDMDTNSRRSPASYFIDRFQVQKELPEHSTENQNLPFFFKKCNVAGGDWRSRQNYECDVGF